MTPAPQAASECHQSEGREMIRLSVGAKFGAKQKDLFAESVYLHMWWGTESVYDSIGDIDGLQIL